jgi:GrpB-like predicted nucleotidyltransferase (UPF0157 family)
MPFPDELSTGLHVVPYDPEWPTAFSLIAARAQEALGSLAETIDHIGSTAVPGLAAKDCIDVQVRVAVLDEDRLIGQFDKIGFRVRLEPWNRVEVAAGRKWPKLVFAPPIGERASNVHVRETASDTARRNLLFRDFLRANDAARDSWAEFKSRLTSVATNIYQYGELKAASTEILMIAAESWSREAGWSVPL